MESTFLQKYRDLPLLQRMGGFIVFLDLEGRIGSFGGEGEATTGYTSEELMGVSFWDPLFFFGDPEPSTRAFEEAVRTGNPTSVEAYWMTKVGDCRWLTWMLNPLQAETGEIEGVFAWGVDHTAHHAALVQSSRQEEIFRSVASHFPNGIILVYDREFRVTYGGGHGMDELGLTQEVLRQGTLFDPLPPNVQKALGQRARFVLGGMSYQFDVPWNGHSYEVRMVAIRNERNLVTGGLILAQNITLRKEIEGRFVLAKERYQLLFEANPNPMWVYDSQTQQVLAANLAALECYGYNREEFLRMRITDLLSEEDRERFLDYFKDNSPSLMLSGWWNHYYKNGTKILVQLSSHEFDLGERRARLILAINITKQVEVETALQQSESRFRSLVQNSSDVITILDPAGTMVYVSPACEKIFGYPPEELMGKSGFEYMHPNDIEKTIERLEKILQNQGSQEVVEYRFRHAEGHWIALESVGINLLHDPSIQGIVVNSRDISERQQLTAQLRQVQKMDSIGRLAGGIAHDFNNILTAIQGYADLSLSMDLPNENLHDYIQQIAMAANRASTLTRQLLAFSRQQVIQLKMIDLNQAISEMSLMLMRLIGENIHLRVDCDPNISPIEADKGMLEQVILNLVVNARDAMPEGGELTIRTFAVSSPKMENYSGSVTRRPNAVGLEVIDSGCGMDEKTREHIFEPFFTTKEIGKGTGLGLSTVYGIVEQHRGRIEVDSKVDEGTTFRVLLPISAKTISVEAEDGANPVIRGGNETILVVEDEPSVREMVITVLQRQGYQILQAGTVHEALEVWQQNRGAISIVITDIMMPGGLTGCDLGKKLYEEDPQLRVIFCSGYSPRLVAGELALESGVNFLQKPFTPADLARVVRFALENEPSSFLPEK